MQMHDLFAEIRERITKIHSYIDLKSTYSQSKEEDKETIRLMARAHELSILLEELQKGVLAHFQAY